MRRSLLTLCYALTRWCFEQLNSHNLMTVCLGLMKLGLHQESERSQTKKRSFRWINSKVSDASHKWALTSSALQLLLKSWMLILNVARVSNNEVSAFWLTSEPGASGSFKHSFSDRFSTLGSVRSHPRLTSQAVSTETPPACCLATKLTWHRGAKTACFRPKINRGADTKVQCKLTGIIFNSESCRLT